MLTYNWSDCFVGLEGKEAVNFTREYNLFFAKLAVDFLLVLFSVASFESPDTCCCS